ncbi:MAG: hypothetical protein K8S23_01230 [Candidatus Cloacimonetes bacterium]|nr:hypothetical protein [Candidatus Cloacimonadota bacterium]
MQKDYKNIINGDFIKHLREEKLKQQDKRAIYLRAKSFFVLALFSSISALLKFSANSANNDNYWIPLFLIYIIPFIAVMFDFYILGGEFAVKRLRHFLRINDTNENSEKIWENHLKKWPKSFMKYNRFWVTFTINVVSILLLIMYLTLIDYSIVVIILSILWFCAIVALSFFLFNIEKRISKTINFDNLK